VAISATPGRSMIRIMASGHVAAAFAPETVLAEVDGIPIVFAGLLATATGVFLQLFCRRNGVTEALDDEYRLAFEKWQSHAAAARERGEQPTGSPKQPGELLLHVPLILEDDLGTKYQLAEASAAGTGTEWEGSYRFKPAVPRAVSTLTVTIDNDDRRAHSLSLWGAKREL
jgi:hypothetical protein